MQAYLVRIGAALNPSWGAAARTSLVSGVSPFDRFKHYYTSIARWAAPASQPILSALRRDQSRAHHCPPEDLRRTSVQYRPACSPTAAPFYRLATRVKCQAQSKCHAQNIRATVVTAAPAAPGEILTLQALGRRLSPCCGCAMGDAS